MNATHEKTIPAQDLVPMELFTDTHSIHIELAYAHDRAPNIFGPIYTAQEKLILHNNLAKTVLLASKLIHQEYGLHMRLYDGLRTIEAQAKMQASKAVQENPHWLEEPNRLLSPPGAGGHPRGMAVDLTLQTKDGDLLDMGTVFDHLAENPEAEHNPAHRDYPHISAEIKQNRAILTNAMNKAANILNTPLFPLPQEWWDFRLPQQYFSQFKPLSDTALPPSLRMTAVPANDIPDLPPEHFQNLKKSIIEELNLHNGAHNDGLNASEPHTR